MLKNLLTLLATSASLAFILSVASSAYAAPIIELNNAPAISSASVVQAINLNLANPKLNLIARRDNSILHNLGCACAYCAGASRQQPSL
jgi:hypothetical protein